MKPVALLLAGLALLILGPAAPALVGGGTAWVQLVDLGSNAVERSLALPVLEARLPAGVQVQRLSVTWAMLSSRVSAKAVEDAGKMLATQPLPVPVCDVALAPCWDAQVRAQPPFNRGAGPVGQVFEQQAPASRLAWLLGMLVGLVGLALLVLGLAALGPLKPRWRVVVPLAAVAGGLLGAGVGLRLGARTQQVLVYRTVHRPVLPETPSSLDRMFGSTDAAQRLMAPDLSHGLDVTITASANGADVTVNLDAANQAALDQAVARIRSTLLEPAASQHAALHALLEKGVALGHPLADVWKSQLLEPAMELRTQAPDPRGPQRLGPAGALAGLLLAFALAGWPRRSQA